ncbi:MAG: ion channel [Verrucomicrobiota bacterium]|nr:ion channel [Verrucomicrobiota bacterium]
MTRSSDKVSVKAGEFRFHKVNLASRKWRDLYNWVLSLTWVQFGLLLGTAYLIMNSAFAGLYCIGDGIEGMPPHSFPDAFFFSTETLATVGYGHMYPTSLYAHIVSTLEIVDGMFFLAVITGIIFVRFSRPQPGIEFSDSLVIAPFKGQPTLMLRVANLRDRSLVEAKFRIMFMRDEPIENDEEFRHFYTLKLHFGRVISFPAALTLRHTIDESSPLYRETPETLAATEARFVASVNAIETVVPASVQTMRDYSWKDVRFGERFVDIYTFRDEGEITADYGRLHETEAFPPNDSNRDEAAVAPVHRADGLKRRT